MNKMRLKGAWNELVGNFKQRSSQGTGDDVSYGEGQDQKIVGRAQSGLGRVRDRVKKRFGGL